MPTLSMFFGLIIRMFYAPKEHNPPHIHVEYQGKDTIVGLKDGEIINGYHQQGIFVLFKHGLKFTKKNCWQIGNYVKMVKNPLK